MLNDISEHDEPSRDRNEVAEKTSTQARLLSGSPGNMKQRLIIGLGTRRPALCSVALEGIECFVRVSDERQAHLRFLLVRHGASLGTVDGTGVFLRNLVNGEVRNIDVRAKSRLERGTDAAKLIPDHSAEEWVVLDLCGTSVLAAIATNPVLRVTQETIVID